MVIGYIGLGKMGLSMTERLLEMGYKVLAFDKDAAARAKAEEAGAEVFGSFKELLDKLPTPRTIWLMVPHEALDEVILDILPQLVAGDTVIDGGNSNYKNSMRRAKEFSAKKIHFMDVGVSGGPTGARNGACLMIGGERADYRRLEMLFKELAGKSKYALVGPHGAGHFVKMVHNAIEYPMMEAIAEGFDILKRNKAGFKFDLVKIADLYNNGSVIESRLMGWLREGFDEFGEDMDGVSGSVGRSGAGDWAVDVAEEFGVPARALRAAVDVRKKSGEKPSYAGKLLTAMRNRFGGHSVK